MNRREGSLHVFASQLLQHIGRNLIVPWPVFTEVDILLSSRGHANAALRFTRALLDGFHQLHCPGETSLGLALQLATTYADQGLDLPDLVVMAMALERKLPVLTWDFRHFRAVQGENAHSLVLLVQEHELPRSP